MVFRLASHHGEFLVREPRPTIHADSDPCDAPICCQAGVYKNKAKKTRSIRGNVSHGKGRIGELPP